MGDTFIYKCPKCGGKVDYDEANHKWICEYCNNSYEALFEQEEKTLPQITKKKISLYKYKCDNCNKSFISVINKDATCKYCNTINYKEGEEFTISGIVNMTAPLHMITDIYKRNIRKYFNLPKEYYDCSDLKLQYINCDLYNGYIKVSYNGKSTKYIFVNLLVPNIEYDDYRFMYEIGNIGITFSDNMRDNQESIVRKLIYDNEYINSTSDKDYEEDIVTECVNIFAKKNRIKDKSQITVSKRLNVKDGAFLPLYMKKITINDKNYYQYVLFELNKYNQCILELKEKKNAIKKMKIADTISNIILKIIIPICTLLFLYKSQNSMFDYSRKIEVLFLKPLTYKELFSFFIIAIVLLALVGFFLRYLSNYYRSKIKLTKEEYINIIIKNSNFVKIIEKVKK